MIKKLQSFIVRSAYLLLLTLGIAIFAFSYIYLPGTASASIETYQTFRYDILHSIAGTLCGAALIFFLLKLLRAHEYASPYPEYVFVSRLSQNIHYLLSQPFRAALAELHDPRTWSDQEEYMNNLRARIPHLNPATAQIRAVCGYKNWTSGYIEKYIQETGRAAMKGVPVTRLFLQDKSFDKNVTVAEMDNQVRMKIRVKFISKQRLDAQNEKIHQLNDGFGFVIINDESVIVHNNFEGPVAIEFKNALIVAEFVKIFDRLSALQPMDYYIGQAIP